MNAVIMLNRIKWHLEEIYKLRTDLQKLFYTDDEIVDVELQNIKGIINGTGKSNNNTTD